MSEIEYYESNGKFELADRVQQNLTKLARRVKKEDLGISGSIIDAKIGLSFAQLMSQIPSCARIWNFDSSAQVVITQQHEECVVEKQKLGMNLRDAYMSCAQSALDKRKFPFENTEERKALENCLADFYVQFPSIYTQKQNELNSQKLIPTQLAGVKTSPIDRNVPRIPV